MWYQNIHWEPRSMWEKGVRNFQVSMDSVVSNQAQDCSLLIRVHGWFVEEFGDSQLPQQTMLSHQHRVSSAWNAQPLILHTFFTASHNLCRAQAHQARLSTFQEVLLRPLQVYAPFTGSQVIWGHTMPSTHLFLHSNPRTQPSTYLMVYKCRLKVRMNSICLNSVLTRFCLFYLKCTMSTHILYIKPNTPWHKIGSIFHTFQLISEII